MLGVITPTGFMPIDGDAAADRAQAAQPKQGNGQAAADDKGNPGPGKNGTKPAAKVIKSAGAVRMPGAPTERNQLTQAAVTQGVKRFFASQRRVLAAAAEKAYGALLYTPGASKAAEPDDNDDLNKHIAEVLALMPWNYGQIEEELRSGLTEAGKEGAWQGSNQIAAATGGTREESYCPALKEALEYGAERSTGLTGDDPSSEYRLVDAAKNETEKTLRQAVAENWTPLQVSAVMSAVDFLSDARADMIGFQETLRAQSVGWVKAWEASSKVAKVAWRLSPLHKGIDICDVYASHGEVPIGHAFDKGVYLPSDNHPLCACYLEIVEFTNESEEK
jgi:hypothetical protein